MSLFGSLNIGASALAAQQAALQVTGNNIANAGNANYSREVADLSPSPYLQVNPGQFVGTGVSVTDISRQVNESLNARLRGATSDSSAASTTQNFMGQVESSFNALGTNNISTQMSTFFTDWSKLAATPQDVGVRQVVLSDGTAVASSLSDERSQLTTIQGSVQQQINSQVTTANGLLQQIASLNQQIVAGSSGGPGGNNGLLDQRDKILNQLAGLINVTTISQPDGDVNVYSGSTPLVIDTQTNPLTVQQTAGPDKQVNLTINTTSPGGPLAVSSGELGALQGLQSQIAGVMSQVDGLAHNLINAVNEIHSSGQGTSGYTTTTSTNAVASAAAPLNSAAAGLQYTPTNGSFVVHVTNAAGITSSSLVQVNLTGSATDTTLTSLAASLNGIGGVKATIANGQITIASTNTGSTLSFSQDSSGVLSSLGVNTFFTGSDAATIGVNQTLQNNPSLIAAAQNGDPGDNQNALAIAALNTQKLTSIGGQSLQDSYQSIINNVSGTVATATTESQASTAVTSALTTQQQSLSGVSLDEESTNMLIQQRSYQGAAVFITTVNNMMTSLLAMIP
jgi:flagellar hook-associated protein 1 FlgK